MFFTCILWVIQKLVLRFLPPRVPVVAMGVLRWIDWTVSEPSYFKLLTDHTPIHLALLDEISTCHPLLHPHVLKFLIRLLETTYPDLDVLVQVMLQTEVLLLNGRDTTIGRANNIPVKSTVHFFASSGCS